MTVPAHLHYNADHEWLEETDGTTTVGLTKHAASALGDIVYVQLPSVGDRLVGGQSCGAVESNKTASGLYSPASGQVVAVNEALRADPSLINRDPYGDGWLFRILVTDVGALLTAAQYEELTLLPLPDNPC